MDKSNEGDINGEGGEGGEGEELKNQVRLFSFVHLPIPNSTSIISE